MGTGVLFYWPRLRLVACLLAWLHPHPRFLGFGVSVGSSYGPSEDGHCLSLCVVFVLVFDTDAVHESRCASHSSYLDILIFDRPFWIHAHPMYPEAFQPCPLGKHAGGIAADLRLSNGQPLPDMVARLTGQPAGAPRRDFITASKVSKNG